MPTHFFKVVLAERIADKNGDSGGSTEAVMGAFVLPNAPLQADLPLTAFSVPLDALEEAAGGLLVVNSVVTMDRSECSVSRHTTLVPPR